MPNYTINTTLGEGELPIKVEFDYYPGQPGKLTGPMEDSYEAEAPTLEICEVLASPGIGPNTWDITDALSDSWNAKIEEICLNHVASIGES